MQLITGGAVPLDEVAEVHFPETLKYAVPHFWWDYKSYQAGINVVPPQRYITEPEPVRRMKYLVNYLMSSAVKDAVIGVLFDRLFGVEIEADIAAKMFLSPDDVRRLADAGMSIGCHTRSHYNLATIEDSIQVRREVVEAKGEIEAATGARVTLFAYPAGGREGYTPECAELVARHYEAAVITGTQRDLVTPADSIFELPRIHEKFFGEVV